MDAESARIRERKGETGSSGTGREKSSIVTQKVAPSLPFAPGFPPRLSLPPDLQLILHTLWSALGPLDTCTGAEGWWVVLVDASCPQHPGPAMASLQGSSAQGICQNKNSLVPGMPRKTGVLRSSVCPEDALCPSLLEAGNRKVTHNPANVPHLVERPPMSQEVAGSIPRQGT